MRRAAARTGGRRAIRVAAVAAALAIAGLGMYGAYGYGRDYNLHRGFSALVPLRRAGTGRLLQVHFYSRALRREADYLVYLPPHYSSAERYPAYYLLHGMPGQPHVFVTIANMDVRLDNQLTLGRARPMILVYPDGRIGGSVYSDSEWANTPSGAFESYVIEVMRDVDHRFSTIPKRDARVIGGFSAGAYGAMNIVLHHLGDFANVQSWSGYYLQTRTGVFAHASPAALAYNSPLDEIRHLGPRLRRDPLRAYMYIGRADESAPQQRPMSAALAAEGARVHERFYRGGHDWQLWYPRLNQMLDMASADFRHPPRPLGAASPRAAARAAQTLPQAPRTSQTVTRHHDFPPRHAQPGWPRRSLPRLIGALLLALVASALINLGFVLQHRGHASARRRGRDGLLAGGRDPQWLLGQAIGWAGWLGQIVAVALVPLTIVQAFAAGSLAIAVPLATWLFDYRIGAGQLAAVGAIGISLASLALGVGAHGQLEDGLLIGIALALGAAATVATLAGASAVRAITSGIFYGIGDGAIKADAIALHHHGVAGLVGGWTVVAALATLGGFLSFQAALQDHDAVRPLSLMAAFTAVTGVAIGVTAFHEPLGASVALGIMHAAAIALVLVCVPVLVRVQQQLALGRSPEAGPAGAALVPPVVSETPARVRRPMRVPVRRWAGRVAGRTIAVSAVVVAGVAATGLLFWLRELGWLALGPRVADALPLLQLAGFSAQPLVRVIVAFVAVGLALGVALAGMAPRSRLAVTVPVTALLMLVASDASYALARNLRLGHVLLTRAPGFGPWLEWLLLTAAAALPGSWTLLASMLGRRHGSRSDEPGPVPA